MKLKEMQHPMLAAAAVLAVFAMAVTLLLSSGAPAHATTETPTPTPPRHTTPDACPGVEGGNNPNEQAAHVVDSGHYALFDVYWNPDGENELTNNPCPPEVTHVPAKTAVPPSFGNPGSPATPAKDDRSPSSINIAQTIIHIPNSAKVELRDPDTPTPYTNAKYPELWEADDEENPNGSGDGIVWVLPACPPDGPLPSDSSMVPLCISFSAALLNPEDWVNADRTAGGKVDFHIDHVHQTDTNEQDARYVLAYDVPDPDTAIPYDALWDTSDADISVMSVTPGKYERPMWFFTSPGTFEFQVHIKGHPSHADERTDGLDPVAIEDSVTSDVREYIFHVGAESDVDVDMTVTPETPSPQSDVTLTITTSNAGPDVAPSTHVDVTLPEGLTYSSHETMHGTFAYDDENRVWTWEAGSLASDGSKTLTVTATVDAKTHGRTLKVKATISATEDVRGYTVPVADPTPTNNLAASTITVSGAHVPPVFQVEQRTMPENAADVNVGTPIEVSYPNGNAEDLVFSLDEDGQKDFTVSNVGGNAQIAIKPNPTTYFNFEEAPETYSFRLHVSDMKDANGDPDPDAGIDASISVVFGLTDVQETGRFAMEFFAEPYPPVAGQTIRACLNPEAYPGSAQLQFNYLWQARDPGSEVDWSHNSGRSNCINIHEDEAGTREYRGIGFTPLVGDTRNAAETPWEPLTWREPPQ